MTLKVTRTAVMTLALVAVGVYGAIVCWGLTTLDNWPARGQVGDFYGGLANAFALAAILVALFVQQQELVESTKARAQELEHSRELVHFQMVREYYRDGDNPEQREARKVVYNTAPERLVGTAPAENVASFFHSWGMLVKKGAMPPWVFLETATGDRVVSLHTRLQPHIAAEREKAPDYASGFVWLAEGIKTRRLNPERVTPPSGHGA